MVLAEMTTEVAQMLCNDVRAVSSEQLAHHLFRQAKAPIRSANRMCRKLAREGMVTKRRAVVSLIPVQAPLFRWDPATKDAPPNFYELSYANERRWQEASTRSTTILVATEKAHSLFGGKQRGPRTNELEHDLAVSSVFLTKSPNAKWTHEDSLPADAFGGFRPDAVIENGETIVVDVLGRGYKAARIEHTFNHFREHVVELR